jgi:hypothetical protein
MAVKYRQQGEVIKLLLGNTCVLKRTAAYTLSHLKWNEEIKYKFLK